MNEVGFIEGLIFFCVVVIIVRNFRKDRSDGRDPLGGGGGGGSERPPTRVK